MAAKFKRGSMVSQIVPVIEGSVAEIKFVEDDICYLVEFSGIDGEQHSRWFKEEELEELEVTK